MVRRQPALRPEAQRVVEVLRVALHGERAGLADHSSRDPGSVDHGPGADAWHAGEHRRHHTEGLLEAGRQVGQLCGPAGRDLIVAGKGSPDFLGQGIEGRGSVQKIVNRSIEPTRLELVVAEEIRASRVARDGPGVPFSAPLKPDIYHQI